MTKNIKKDLPTTSFALTHDVWTNCGTESFTGPIQAIFIPDD